MNFVRIAVAVEIAAEHHGLFVGAGDRRELRRERVALGRATAAERLRQREAVELRQELEIAGVVGAKRPPDAERDSRDNQCSGSDALHRPPGNGCLSGIGPV